MKSGVTALISTVLVRHFISTNGHFSQANNGSSNTNTTGSGRSSKVPHQHNQNTSDEKREDLNILVKKDAGSSVKYKKESDYGLIGGHRRGSRDKDDGHSHRRSRDGDFHLRREREEYSSVHSSGREKLKDSETDPWLEVGCKLIDLILNKLRIIINDITSFSKKVFHLDQWFSNQLQLYQYLSTVSTLYSTSIYRKLIISTVQSTS